MSKNCTKGQNKLQALKGYSNNYESQISWKKSMNSFFCNALIFKSSPSQIFFKIDVLKNFTSFTGKHLCWSLLLIKLQTLRPATLLKRDSNTGVFLWNWRSFFKNSFFYRTPSVASSVVFAAKQRNNINNINML